MLISEFLQNPLGKDTEGEFIELVNEGSEQVLMQGWSIQDGSGKKVTIGNKIMEPNEYLALPYSQTKLTLNNDKEKLTLYNAQGIIIHEIDTQKEGIKTREGESIAWVNGKWEVTQRPTPGEKNIIEKRVIKKEAQAPYANQITGTAKEYSENIIIPPGNETGVVGMALVVGLVGATTYMILSKWMTQERE